MRSPLLLLVLVLAGCHGSDPCAGNPAACQDSGVCPGQCAKAHPDDWFADFLLWSGPKDAAPDRCPDVAPLLDQGFIDTPPTVTCGGCLCFPSQGSCDVPFSMVANAGPCPGTGSGTPFNAPEPWNTACDTGPTVSSAGSLSITPVQPYNNSCQASAHSLLSVASDTVALACNRGFDLGNKCPHADETCTYAPLEGFRVCLFHQGDVPCPEGWPEKHLWFDQQDLCTCSCGEIVGESCSSTVTVYKDGMCSQPLGSVTVSSGDPVACVDVAPGSSLGSKSATPPVYQAGTCQPKLEKTPSVSVCCLQ